MISLLLSYLINPLLSLSCYEKDDQIDRFFPTEPKKAIGKDRTEVWMFPSPHLENGVYPAEGGHQMTRKIFSKNFRTFNQWLKGQEPNSRYAKRITSLHERFPSMNLRELKHVRVSDYDLSGTKWDTLTPNQRRDRILALEVMRVMRKGERLKNTLANTDMKKEVAILHLGKYLTKERGYWRVKSLDSIEAELAIYDKNAGYTTIITTCSHDRTLIGKYLAAVRIALNTGDPSVLTPFENVVITGANGDQYEPETDLEALHEMSEAQEEPEFMEIYQS